MIGFGIRLLVQSDYRDLFMLGAGCVALCIVICAWPITSAINRYAARSREEMCGPISERLDQMAILLNLMSEQQLLSDRAKAVAFREKDREALRRAVQEEMGRQDWEAAEALADDMERLF